MFFFFKKYPLKLCPRPPCPHRRPVHTGAAQSQLCTLGSREGPVVPFLTENKGVLSQAVAVGFRGREEGGPAVPVPVGPHACLPGVPPGRHAEPPAPTRVHSALGPRPHSSSGFSLLCCATCCTRLCRAAVGLDLATRYNEPSLPTLCPLPFCM